MDSIPAPFLTDDGYAEIGFMSGLEVHRQVLTERKLFCHCPPGLYSERVDAEALRHMRPTLSEMGGYDGTALMEFKTRKDILYLLDGRTVCTYEMDDTPPFPPDREAIDIALMQAMAYGCSLVGEIHIIRKQYLDGSIPTGFQRTFLVGVGGSFPMGDRRIGVTQISLEEDSCREVSDHGHLRMYRGDRLGMPITEVVTEPEFKTPAQVVEGARVIQAVSRTLPIRRGIGTARQDVNVSVRGGTRVEIKGVPRIPLIPVLTHYEAVRQKRLLMLSDELNARDPGEPEVDRHRIRLPRYGGLLQWAVGPERTFFDELKGRVRVIACLFPDLAVQVEEDGEDAVLRVEGPDEDVRTALSEIAIRAKEARRGVPSETRQALASGATRFERILPGADRMYPDTDMPPIAVTADDVARLEERMPEAAWDRYSFARQSGVSECLAQQLVISPRWTAFRAAVEAGAKPSRAASLLVETARRVEREGHALNGVDWPSILERDLQKKDERAAVLEVLT
ncbi:MAG: Glu-tRNA(Gln) amidotransferase subunit GatE [Planctomycetota bacterium]